LLAMIHADVYIYSVIFSTTDDLLVRLRPQKYRIETWKFDIDFISVDQQVVNRFDDVANYGMTGLEKF